MADGWVAVDQNRLRCSFHALDPPDRFAILAGKDAAGYKVPLRNQPWLMSEAVPACWRKPGSAD